MSNYAIILAGGAGTRFWPLSRNSSPKQFLSLYSKKTLIEETIGQISCLVKPKNIYIGTNKIHRKQIKQYANKLSIPLKNILFEPQVKNNFAAIALLSRKINLIDPEAVIIVMPSDNVIRYKRKFLGILKKAIGVAKKGYIVTLGAVADRPETGFGYIKIKTKDQRPKTKEKKFFEVEKFVEKPGLSLAKKFIKDKRYFWNGGIFIFKADVMLKEINKYQPRVYKMLAKINKKNLEKMWGNFPQLSIDYAIMEKTKRGALLPANYGWLDVGNWQAMQEILKKDARGNTFKGNCIDMASRDSFVWAGKRQVATLGLNNIVVVDTEDALLVCAKDKVHNVKNIVELLRKKRKNCV